jgi:hypothetical protein
LPKLRSIKERADNRWDIGTPPRTTELIKNLPNLYRLKIEEDINVGLKPSNYWKKR